MEVEPHTPQRLTIRASQTVVVSGLLLSPDRARACLVLAHGAGAGMTHPFMIAAAAGLYERGIGTLRYQFPYMEVGSRRPDGPGLAQATVRAAVNEANVRLPDLALFAGGKSFGGRMTSQAQAESPLPNVRGIAFFGFPLHPAGKPSVLRAGHLLGVQVPMLLLQGDRDALAQPDLIKQTVAGLGDRATITLLPDADHSFHVRARSGRTDEQVKAYMFDAIADWIDRVIAG
jgi:predicted alpha/beta-hydrolase family hydrolase